ncbi:uncharacterized protein LOC133304071 [Gastrolobium bilobum]|uniref:uncharacterized protein LOC133304071 n=1 Tax=Gastrolobium bilobum TaxID=150636 RepID=UPI002AB019E4|nr:uncharacterized protein LOC133304071 [Gastrolobium bilobum]
MLPLKLVRSLVLGETINHNPHMLTQNQHNVHTHDDDDDDDDEEEANEAHATSQPHHQRRRRRKRRSKTPCLVFLPNKEIIRDTYRLATIARDLGMDLYPTPSLSHIIFSNPSSTPSSSSSTSPPSTCSFSASSATWSLLNDAVPIPFPSLAAAPLTHLRFFVNLSPRAFKLVLFNSDGHRDAAGACGGNGSNWDCCSVSLYSRVAGHRVDTMEGFCRVLAGKGWTFFRTSKNPSAGQGGGGGGGGAVYLFRKVEVNRVRMGRVSGVGAPDGACRVRELRLPHLDFGNAPLRILQYILLMTDDIFCLA